MTTLTECYYQTEDCGVCGFCTNQAVRTPARTVVQLSQAERLVRATLIAIPYFAAGWILGWATMAILRFLVNQWL